MSRYRKVPKSEHDVDDEDGNEHAYHPSSSSHAHSDKWETEKLILPGCILVFVIYISITLTVLCVFQFMAAQSPESDPGGLAGRTRGEFYEWKFFNNATYESLSHENDHFWDWPSGTGLSVPEPVLGNHAQVSVGFSMFHQLHCLQMIRMTLQQAAEKQPTIELDDHIPHCMDYLWKSILCAADGAVELPSIIDGMRNTVIDGEGAVHQCRNPKNLFELRGWDIPDLVAMQINKTKMGAGLRDAV